MLFYSEEQIIISHAIIRTRAKEQRRQERDSKNETVSWWEKGENLDICRAAEEKARSLSRREQMCPVRKKILWCLDSLQNCQ